MSTDNGKHDRPNLDVRCNAWCVTNGNIYPPVVMVAEKAADLIRGDTPHAAADIGFYRHERPSPRQA